MRVLLDADADFALLRGLRVAVIGYGNQGRAQALNLSDSGVETRIGLAEGSSSRARAERDGFVVATPAQACAWADLAALLVPDEKQAELYRSHVAPHLRPGGALLFAHGLTIRFGLIVPRPDLDVVLVAPKGPGTALRARYQEGSGLMSLIGVGQNATGGAHALALAYAAALGSGRVGIIESSFAEESEADLFNEQAVVWGGVPQLLMAGFETLVEAGFAPEIAYLECVTELKLLADLIHERGLAGMREAISNTAEFGAMEGGPRIVTPETRAEMRRILAEVRAGGSARGLWEDASAGYPRLRKERTALQSHPIEEVGRRIMAMSGDAADLR